MMGNCDFEGFDANVTKIYTAKDEREERWHEAKIWIILAAVAYLCLFLTVLNHAPELKLMSEGNAITLPYDVGDTSVKTENEAGKTLYINVSEPFSAKPSGGEITLYYYGDSMREAKNVTAMWFWVVMYGTWGGLALVSSFFIYKNLFGGRHSHGRKSSY